MTVKSSGIIGITTDVVAEFGGTAPHGLTEYYRGGSFVPNNSTNAGIPTSGQIGLTSFYGAKAVTYFAAEYENYNSTGVYWFYPTSAVITSTNIAILGYTANSSSYNNNLAITLTTESGAQVANRMWLYNSAAYPVNVIQDTAYVSSSDRIYAVGYFQNGSGYTPYGTLTELYSNGQYIQWKYGGTGSYDRLSVITAHTDGSIYVGGYSNAAGESTYRGFIAKANSTLGYTWQYTISANTSLSSAVDGLGTDSTGNVYVSHGSTWRDTSILAALTKYNPSGTRQWSYTCNVAAGWIDTGLAAGSPIVFDTSGNGYAIMSGMQTQPGTYGVPPAVYATGILKFDADGTMHKFGYTTSTINDITVDGNVLYAVVGGSYVAVVNTSTMAVNNAVLFSFYPKGNGTISVSSTSTLVTGTDTKFDLEARTVGEVYFANGASIGIVNNVVSNTTLYLVANSTATYSGNYYSTYAGTVNIVDIKVSGSELYATGYRSSTYGTRYPLAFKIDKTLPSNRTVGNAGIVSVTSQPVSFTTTTPSSVTSFTPTTTTPSITMYDPGGANSTLTITSSVITL